MKQHLFEKAGLGRAPFAYVGCEYRVGPIKLASSDGCETWAGAPGQPMGACAYCGQGIAECHLVRSADGRTFTVGCDCIRKVDDAGLVVSVSKAKRKAEHAKADARTERAAKLLEREDVRSLLAAELDPRSLGKRTLLESIEWLLEHAGRAGKLRAAKAIEKAAKTAEEAP
jgi:hypothetical protein